MPDLLKMSGLDLYDWVKLYKCVIEALPEHKAKVLKVTNPCNECKTFLYLPIDAKPVRDYTVFKACSDLGIPVPNHVSYMKSLHDQITNDHSIKRKNRK